MIALALLIGLALIASIVVHLHAMRQPYVWHFGERGRQAAGAAARAEPADSERTSP